MNTLLSPIKLPLWVYELLTILVASMWVATVAACFALAFLGKPIPAFATTQLEWMTLALGCVRAIPHPKRTQDPSAPSSAQSTALPSEDAAAEDVATPDDAVASPNTPTE